MKTLRQLHTLFTKLGYDKEARGQRIFAWTSGRITSGSALNEQELDDLFMTIKSEYDLLKATEQSKKKEKRSIILTTASLAGIKKSTGWEEFNAFMLHKSVVKKDLRLCSLDELDAVARQLRAVLTNTVRSAQIPGTKAWHDKRGFAKPCKN